jgi:hypothetical protein
MAAGAAPVFIPAPLTLEDAKGIRIEVVPPEVRPLVLAGDPGGDAALQPLATAHDGGVDWLACLAGAQGEPRQLRLFARGSGPWQPAPSPPDPPWPPDADAPAAAVAVFHQGALNLLYLLPGDDGPAPLQRAIRGADGRWTTAPMDPAPEADGDALALTHTADGEYWLYAMQPNATFLRYRSDDLRRWAAPEPVTLAAHPGEKRFRLTGLRPFARGAYWLALARMEGPAGERVELAMSGNGLVWRRMAPGEVLPRAIPTGPLLQGGGVRFIGREAGGLVSWGWDEGRIVAVAADSEGGTFTTGPIALTAAPLALHGDTRQGALEVEVLDTGKVALAGYRPCRLADAAGPALPLEWEGFDSTELPLTACRLRIRLEPGARFFAVTH